MPLCLLRLLTSALHTFTAHCAANVYTSIPASGLKAGDRILVKATPSDPASGFVLATVKGNFRGPSTAAYKPVVDAPYMVLGGVLLPT